MGTSASQPRCLKNRDSTRNRRSCNGKVLGRISYRLIVRIGSIAYELSRQTAAGSIEVATCFG